MKWAPLKREISNPISRIEIYWNKANYNFAFMKIIKSGFTLILLLLWAGSVMAQHVHSYPQDGKIKDLKGKVQQDIVVAKIGRAHV